MHKRRILTVRRMLVAIVALLVIQVVLSATEWRRQMKLLVNISNTLRAMPTAMQTAIEQAEFAIDARHAQTPEIEQPTTATSPISTKCQDHRVCSGVFYAAGYCTGKDQVPIRQRAWEKSDILIHAVSIGIEIRGPRPTAGYARVGNSAMADIMAQQIGTGTSNQTLNPPFVFPARIDEHTHLDVHVNCRGPQNYEVWALIFYSVVEDSETLK